MKILEYAFTSEVLYGMVHWLKCLNEKENHMINDKIQQVKYFESLSFLAHMLHQVYCHHNILKNYNTTTLPHCFCSAHRRLPVEETLAVLT